ncbi:MAG: efflux RND transporter periplasmic adaptor subunit [Fuerstiella sp.]
MVRATSTKEPGEGDRNDPGAPAVAPGAASTAAPTAARRSLRGWLSVLVTPLIYLVVGATLVFGIGLAQRLGWISSGTAGSSVSSETEPEVHTCPMHPQIRQPGPGRCPICGMPLVPAAASEGSELDELSVRIEPAQRRLANIETATVELKPVQARIQTVGSIAIDESRMATIASYIDGRLERLFADYTGVSVAKGDHLAVVYSPELYTAQIEYLESRATLAASSSTLEAVRQAQQKLAVGARRKLVELGMQEDQILELETSNQARSRLTIYTPIGGTVINKLAVEGKYIRAGDPIYQVADLSTVWLMLELYPEDAARIRFGQRVESHLTSLPGEVFHGRVAFIAPTVNEKKRSVAVRVEFLNEFGRLRPGDYADATIFLPIGQQGEVYDEELAGKWISPMHPQIIRDQSGACPICGMDLVPTSRYGYSNEPVAQPPSLVVPRSAVLLAGNNSVVYVEEEPGRFEIRPVTLGPILREQAIIIDGLQEGEAVATAGNFLIDSQMQLAGKPSLIDPSLAVARMQESKQRNVPLLVDSESVAVIGGDAGLQLEALFQTYFRIQNNLARDQRPSEQDSTELHQLAEALADRPEIPGSAGSLLSDIVTASEHLHHLELKEARHDAFRPISHAVVQLAALVRGTTDDKPYYQMFCPMVKGGAGDWLQSDNRLQNPYWGAQMLECGDVVRELGPGKVRPEGDE